jgi:hypothetical protein
MMKEMKERYCVRRLLWRRKGRSRQKVLKWEKNEIQKIRHMTPTIRTVGRYTVTCTVTVRTMDALQHALTSVTF